MDPFLTIQLDAVPCLPKNFRKALEKCYYYMPGLRPIPIGSLQKSFDQCMMDELGIFDAPTMAKKMIKKSTLTEQQKLMAFQMFPTCPFLSTEIGRCMYLTFDHVSIF